MHVCICGPIFFHNSNKNGYNIHVVNDIHPKCIVNVRFLLIMANSAFFTVKFTKALHFISLYTSNASYTRSTGYPVNNMAFRLAGKISTLKSDPMTLFLLLRPWWNVHAAVAQDKILLKICVCNCCMTVYFSRTSRVAAG